MHLWVAQWASQLLVGKSHKISHFSYGTPICLWVAPVGIPAPCGQVQLEFPSLLWDTHVSTGSPSGHPSSLWASPMEFPTSHGTPMYLWIAPVGIPSPCGQVQLEFPSLLWDTHVSMGSPSGHPSSLWASPMGLPTYKRSLTYTQ